MDGRNPAANASDDGAIATDKQALLPGQAASASNVTNYSRGINGIFVDINDLAPGAGKALGAADFSFRSVGGGEPAAVAPPASVTVRRGAGVGGSDRVTLVWPDYGPDAGAAAAALANGWLEVTVKANEHTGLAAPDVFAFGNLIGETGGDGRVNALDLGAVKSLLNTAAPIDSRVDFNHDGRVNALDLGIVKRYLNQSLPAPLPPVPAAPSPAPFAGATAALRLENEGGLVNLAGE